MHHYFELIAWLGYRNDHRKITFWQAQNGLEVDFVIGENIAIEVKTSEQVTSKHVKGLKALNEEIALDKRIIVSHDKFKRVVDQIEIYPVH